MMIRLVGNRGLIEEYFAYNGGEAVLLDGLDDAILGIAEQHAGVGPVVAYSLGRIYECLRAQGVEDVEEYYSQNIGCLGIGDETPVIVDDIHFI